MVLPDFDYSTPVTLENAFEILQRYPEDSMVMAGGCDVIPPMKQGAFSEIKHIVDIKHIPGLDDITYSEAEGLKIGCLVKLFDVQESDVVRRFYPAVAQASKYIASTQVRNKGTYMGNICAAVPSCDGGPILIAGNAEIQIESLAGSRCVPASDFFTGVRKTCLRHGEIATHIVIPPMASDERAVYIKFAVRKAMDLAIVGVAVWLKTCGSSVLDARIALGAVAEKPFLSVEASEFLKGRELCDEVIDECSVIAMNSCRPISDVRASKEYRTDMVRVFTKRAILKAMDV